MSDGDTIATDRHATPSSGSEPKQAVGSRSDGTAARGDPAGYYGVPVIHKPHWKWLIIVYFFLGGIAGAAYVIAVIADLFGRPTDRRIVRAGHYVSVAALGPSPVLLILDLGHPERFANMLRVLKLRSPMSLGTWGLTLFGGCSALSACAEAAQDGLLGRGWLAQVAARLPSRPIGAVGAPLGLFVAGYTGVLLAATAVPLWTKSPLFLGPIFLNSALSTAVATITAVLALEPGTPRETLDRLERLERIAILSELTLLATWLARLGPTARPLMVNTTGRLLRRGTIAAGLVLPVGLHVLKKMLPESAARPLTAAGSALVLTGGFILRYAVVVGGHASADDPQATLELAGTSRSRPD